MNANEISLVIQNMLHSLCSCTSFTSLRTNINTVHALISVTYNRAPRTRCLAIWDLLRRLTMAERRFIRVLEIAVHFHHFVPAAGSSSEGGCQEPWIRCG